MGKIITTAVKISLLLICSSISLFSQTMPVSITIDLQKDEGSMKHIWAWFGYDEPNYTYMKNGKKLLSELAALSPVPVYVRTHNLMTSGDGTPALKWGSTNMYSEDSLGNPVYSWTIVDRIFDMYIDRNMKPFVEIGFMPEALSTHPEPYQHHWSAGGSNKLETGWAYPPRDFKKWAELIRQWVKHSLERYGKAKVESWYWELWNEPDIMYFMSPDKVTDYCRMYDYASEAVKRALPTARIGGPHTTGGGAWFLRSFIRHCLSDTNAATSKIGAPLDFVTFHAKGSPEIVNRVVHMGMKSQLNSIKDNFSVITSFAEIKNLPVIIGESDPEGCAACGVMTHPENAYRNGTLYSSYEAASIARIYDMADHYGVNLVGAVNWSFEFENQPWFAGFRSLATNGVDKPVLNVFRMLGMMSGNRVGVSGDLRYNFKTICDSGAGGEQTDINALARKNKNVVTVLLWNYHDLDIQDTGSPVVLNIRGIPAEKATVTHYRIDNEHSNSYEVWKKMGSPQNPTADQIGRLEKGGQLEMLSKPSETGIKDSVATVRMQLPRQAVSLVQVSY